VIGDREKKYGIEILKKTRTIKVRMMNEREEWVYIVAQAARRRHARYRRGPLNGLGKGRWWLLELVMAFSPSTSLPQTITI
jgi:hypothetical protein